MVRQAELKFQYGPTLWQVVKLGAGGLAVAGLYTYVFTHQQQVLQFLTPEGTGGQALAAVSLLLFVPLIAYLYGNLAKWLLKLVRIE